MIRISLISVFTALLLSSCYYDNYQELYPQQDSCDTTNVTFSGYVWPVINSNCTGCHSSSVPSGNVSLSNYNEIVTAAANGSLMGTIRHEAGYSPMPKGGGKLTDCEIKKLEIWIADGTPDN